VQLNIGDPSKSLSDKYTANNRMPTLSHLGNQLMLRPKQALFSHETANPLISQLEIGRLPAPLV
jgi:hypothetical protein